MAVPSLDELGDRLGIVLKDPDAIHQAFVHSSYFNENPTAAAGHNERLEFLGDAVIGLIVSRLLYERFPDEDEGLLTARRAALVNRDALASLGLSIGFACAILAGVDCLLAVLLVVGYAKRDPRAGVPFQGTQEEIRKNVKWIHQLFS